MFFPITFKLNAMASGGLGSIYLGEIEYCNLVEFIHTVGFCIIRGFTPDMICVDDVVR